MECGRPLKIAMTMNTVLHEIPWARRLKLRHLEMFLAVHASGSLSEAARRLHLTQPAMSHWLAELEGTVGTPLFTRGRQLVLTPAGEVLRRHAERMVSDITRTNEELAALGSGLVGRLHVGTILSGAPVLLPKAITRLQRLSPGIFVSVVESGIADLLERLDKRELDVIIGCLDLRVLRCNFTVEALMKDRVQVVASPDHPFVRQKKPRWSDSHQYPWIMPPLWSLMRTRVEEAFAEQRVKCPTAAVEMSSSLAVQMLMRENSYLSIMPDSVARLYDSLGLIKPVRLSPAIDFPDVGVIWAPDRVDPAAMKFIDVLRHEAQEL